MLDTQKIGKVILHRGRVKTGRFKKGDFVSAEISSARRLSIARNHTATHLLQAALRKVLGAHVKQQGSLVSEERLRFDFTHFKDIGRQELKRVEELVNNYILEAPKVIKKQLTLKEAKKKGALAFFGEKYESKVRMVSVGDISLELCAGTHLDSASQIGLFKIIQEGSIASGVRRIEATTGRYAYKMTREEEDIITDIAASLNSPVERLTQDLEKRLGRIKELEKQLNNSKMEAARDNLDSIINSAKVVNGIKIITGELKDSGMDILRKSVDMLKQKSQDSVILLGSVNSGRVLLVLGVTAELCQKGLDAQKLINEVSVLVDGSGGGRKDFAQAGGSNPGNLKKAFLRLEELIKITQ